MCGLRYEQLLLVTLLQEYSYTSKLKWNSYNYFIFATEIPRSFWSVKVELQSVFLETSETEMELKETKSTGSFEWVSDKTQSSCFHFRSLSANNCDYNTSLVTDVNTVTAYLLILWSAEPCGVTCGVVMCRTSIMWVMLIRVMSMAAGGTARTYRDPAHYRPLIMPSTRIKHFIRVRHLDTPCLSINYWNILCKKWNIFWRLIVLALCYSLTCIVHWLSFPSLPAFYTVHCWM